MYQILLLLSLFSLVSPLSAQTPKKLLLIYAKSHDEPGLLTERIQDLKQLAKENTFILDTTRINSKFSERYLQKYETLIFINPAPELLDLRQRKELERYIQAGGGLLQISAPVAEGTDWPWYTRLQEAGLKAQYVKSFQVADKNQLKYWRTAFEGGFYSQITLTNEKESFRNSDWFEYLPEELNYVTNHSPPDYQKAKTKKTL